MPKAAYQQAQFTIGVHSLDQLPKDEGFEVAFAGRSNSGKSSAINKITGQNKLARTSKTPGRTQQINFFQLDEKRNIVDLPGYGYAKVPTKIKLHWQATLQKYLSDRQALQGLVMMMDSRHLFTEYDVKMLRWCQHSGMSTHILLTKCDKLSRGAANKALHTVQATLAKEYGVDNEDPWGTVQLFSALKGTGVDHAREVLDFWFQYDGQAEKD